MVNNIAVSASEYAVLSSLTILLQNNNNFTKWLPNPFNVSEDDLFATARKYALIHTVSRKINLSSPWQDTSNLFNTYILIAEHVLRVQQQCWAEVHEQLIVSDISSLVLKGLYFLSHVMDSKEKYICNDIDILVLPENISIVKNIMRTSGYSQNIVSHANKIYPVPDEEIKNFEQHHYELFPFTKIVEVPELSAYHEYIVEVIQGHPFVVEGNRIFLAIEIDIHHTLSLGLENDDVWFKPLSFELLGKVADTLAPDTMAWFLPARFYHEVMVLAARKVKLLGDLIEIIQLYDVDWDHVLQITEKYSLGPSLYYVYRYLESIEETLVPRNLVKRLWDVSNIGYAYHDWGDFIPKLVNHHPLFNLIVKDSTAK